MRSLAVCLLAGLAAGPLAAQEIARIPVYFQVDESTLTAEAIAAVDEAASEIKARGLTTKIVIAGSERAEPAGSDLIAARAQAIQAELIARGVAKDSIHLLTTAGRTAALAPSRKVAHPTSSLDDRRAEIILE